MKTLTAFVKATALAAVLLSAPAAFASEKIAPELKDKITAKLTAEGYDVRNIKMENGKLEVSAVKDGKTMEFFLDDKLNATTTEDGGSEGSEG